MTVVPPYSSMPTIITTEPSGLVVRRDHAQQLMAFGALDGLDLASHLDVPGLKLPRKVDGTVCEWSIRHIVTMFDALCLSASGAHGLELSEVCRIATEVRGGLDLLHRVEPFVDPAPGFPWWPSPPTSLARVLTWLDEASFDNGRSRVARDELRRRMRPAELAELREELSFMDDLALAPRVLIHGGVSLVNLRTSPECDSPGWVLLTGPELRIGPREFDFGMLLGELAEIAFVSAATGAVSPSAVAFGRSLLQGGLSGLNASAITAAMLARVMLHLLDFATFVGNVPEWDLYIELLRFLSETGPACFE